MLSNTSSMFKLYVIVVFYVMFNILKLIMKYSLVIQNLVLHLGEISLQDVVGQCLSPDA
jgi:hypothetical protein